MDQGVNSNRVSAKQKLLLCGCLIMVLGVPVPSVHAEYLGLLAGREATPARTADLSVELGFVNGDLGEFDYQNTAARVNYRLSPEVVFMGTVGIGEFGQTNGVPLGLGISYHLSNQRISEKVEIAGRASYHFGDFSFGGLDGKLASLALEVLVSGAEPLMNNGLAWYSNFGYHRITVDFGRGDSTNELGLGAGLVLPASVGEVYFGFDLIDELSIGLGIRYFVQ